MRSFSITATSFHRQRLFESTSCPRISTFSRGCRVLCRLSGVKQSRRPLSDTIALVQCQFSRLVGHSSRVYGGGRFGRCCGADCDTHHIGAGNLKSQALRRTCTSWERTVSVS